MKTAKKITNWVAHADVKLDRGMVRIAILIPGAKNQKEAEAKLRHRYPARDLENVEARNVGAGLHPKLKAGIMVPHGWPKDNPYWNKILVRQSSR